MPEKAALRLIESQEWLEPAANLLQKAVEGAFRPAGKSRQRALDFLHGKWLGHPLHVAVVDLPVGAWATAGIMDALEGATGNSKHGHAADTAIGIGIAGAVLAALSGIADWHATDGGARRLGLVHALLNVSALGLYTASFMIRRRNGERDRARRLSWAGLGVILASAYLGGELVYEHQVGVNHTAGQTFPKDFTPVWREADVAEGELTRVGPPGGRILLAKVNGTIYATAEVCSHMGGPLSGGRVVDGCVQCPWHGSVFSLRTGKVVHGPSTHPIPALEVRVRDGLIEVRESSKQALTV